VKIPLDDNYLGAEGVKQMQMQLFIFEKIWCSLYSPYICWSLFSTGGGRGLSI